ncbi:MAG: porin family protein [Chitinispirillaceae bacterium]|nr:porin family protein [Chitinispirillaceae bacterium]
MWKKTFLLAGLVSFMAAQAGATGISIGPQLGYYKARDADNGSFIGGVTGRLKFTPVLGAEASINYRQESYANDLVTVRSWPVMVTGLLYPVPFVYGAIGAGWYNVTFDYNQRLLPVLADETKQRFGWHFGGGVEAPAGPSIKLIGDIRYVFIDYDFQEVPGNPKNDFFVIMAGVLFVL